MNKIQEQTNFAVRDLVVEHLQHVSWTDEFSDQVMSKCDELTVDTGALDADFLMNDSMVQAAFKKYVEAVIASFQYLEDVL